MSTVYVIRCSSGPGISPSAARAAHQRLASDEVVDVRTSADLAGRVLAPGDRIVYVAGFSASPSAPAVLRALRVASTPAYMASVRRYAAAKSAMQDVA